MIKFNVAAKKENLTRNLSQIDLYTFDCQGWAIIRNAIPLEWVERAKSAIEKAMPGKKHWKFPVLHLDPVFWDMMTLPVMLEFVEKLCGEEFRLDHAFGIGSDNGVVNLHGGPNCSQRTCFAHWVGGNNILVGQLSVGFTLTPQTPETGGVCYVPGSHKAFDQRDGRTLRREVFQNHFDHECMVVPTLNPGDLSIFTESLIHGDTGWTPNDYSRMQVYYKFCPGFMTWRDPSEQEKYKSYARNELEKRLLENPWSGKFSDTTMEMSRDNKRRTKTLHHA
jgi:hypothetical protein